MEQVIFYLLVAFFYLLVKTPFFTFLRVLYYNHEQNESQN